MGTFHHPHGHHALNSSSYRSSDISVMSDSAASGSRRSWICTRCSYRNCDKVQNICALCGLNNLRSNGAGGRRTIFTIDSNIQLVSRPTSVTTNSVATKVISNTTTTTVNNTNNKSNNLKRRLGRPRAEDDEEVVQPPIVFHNSFSQEEALEQQQQPYHQPQQDTMEEHYDDDCNDEVSIASQDTCRIGSLSDRDSSDRRRPGGASSSRYTKSSSSRGSSSRSRGSQASGLQHPSKLNAEASRTAPKAAADYYSGAYQYNTSSSSSSSSSSSDSDSDAGADAIVPTRSTTRRKSRTGSVRRGSVIPHDDPIEQPRRRRCRQGGSDDGNNSMCESPTKPIRDDVRRDTTDCSPPVVSTSLDTAPEAPTPTTTTTTINKKSSNGRKKKSIKDYIPGLRKSNRHRSSSSRNLSHAATITNRCGGDAASTGSLSTSAAVVVSSSVTPTDVNLNMLKKNLMTIATAGAMNNNDKDTNHTLDLQEEEDEIDEPSFYDNEYGMPSSSCRRTYQASGFRHQQAVVTATPTPGGYLYEI